METSDYMDYADCADCGDRFKRSFGEQKICPACYYAQQPMEKTKKRLHKNLGVKYQDVGQARSRFAPKDSMGISDDELLMDKDYLNHNDSKRNASTQSPYRQRKADSGFNSFKASRTASKYEGDHSDITHPPDSVFIGKLPIKDKSVLVVGV